MNCSIIKQFGIIYAILPVPSWMFGSTVFSNVSVSLTLPNIIDDINDLLCGDRVDQIHWIEFTVFYSQFFTVEISKSADMLLWKEIESTLAITGFCLENYGNSHLFFQHFYPPLFNCFTYKLKITLTMHHERSQRVAVLK